MKKINWGNPRKTTWPFNAILFNLIKLFPLRNKRLWVFGAWEGRKYDDNARALFEHIIENHSDSVRCVWLSNQQHIVDIVRNKGYEAYSTKSLKGAWIALRAGVAIYTNGIIDFGLFPLVGGAKVVSLWHGVGFKKIYNDTYTSGWRSIKDAMDKVFSWTYRNITIATSKYTIHEFATIFNLKDSDCIPIAGQPRNDVFKKKLDRTQILAAANISADKKLVLFMPTYRQAALGKDAMANIVKALYNSEALSNALDVTNSVFVAKLHPLTPKIDIENRENFKIFDFSVIESTQELLSLADTFISDYSSCSVDYALLKRPLIFYTPDHDKFITQSEPLYDEYYEISNKNRCSTPEELAEKILHPSLAAVDAMNELFEDGSIAGTCYSENVYNAVIKEIGL